MSFLDHIDACNNADLGQFEPWYVGSVRAGFTAMLNRGGSKTFRRSLASLLCAMAIVVTLGGTVRPASAQGYALSNDGSLLAFIAPDARTVGLLDWRAGTLKKIEVPPGNYVSSKPTFAPDGRTLHVGFLNSVATRRQFGIFDLATLQLIARYDNSCPSDKAELVLQPGGKSVLTIVGSFPQFPHLCLFDLETRSARIVLPEGEGFWGLGSLSFIADDEILFVGQGPKDPDAVANLNNALKIAPVEPMKMPHVAYRLKFGGRPEIAFPEILERSKILMAPLGPMGPTQLVASRNGEKVVYIDRSLSEEARIEELRKHPKAYAEPFRFDLFVIERGVRRQVTRLETPYPGILALSHDGSTAAVAFVTDEIPKDRHVFDLPSRTREPAIVDMSTGAVTRTDLLARVRADPQFAPSSIK